MVHHRVALLVLLEEDGWHPPIAADQPQDHDLLGVLRGADKLHVLPVHSQPPIISPVVELIHSEDLLIRKDLHRGRRVPLQPCQQLLGPLESALLGSLRDELVLPADEGLEAQLGHAPPDGVQQGLHLPGVLPQGGLWIVHDAVEEGLEKVLSGHRSVAARPWLPLVALPAPFGRRHPLDSPHTHPRHPRYLCLRQTSIQEGRHLDSLHLLLGHFWLDFVDRGGKQKLTVNIFILTGALSPAVPDFCINLIFRTRQILSFTLYNVRTVCSVYDHIVQLQGVFAVAEIIGASTKEKKQPIIFDALCCSYNSETDVERSRFLPFQPIFSYNACNLSRAIITHLRSICSISRLKQTDQVEKETNQLFMHAYPPSASSSADHF